VVEERQQVDFITDYSIRKAQLLDLSGVVSLRVNVFYPEQTTVSNFHTRIMQKIQTRINEGAVCLIAVRNQVGEIAKPSRAFGNVIATAEFSPNDFVGTPMEEMGARRKVYVADVAVRGDARRMGLASKLLKEIDLFCMQNSYDEIYLHVETDNEAAKNLYLKNGFVECPNCDKVVLFTENRLRKSADLYILMKKRVFTPDSFDNLDNYYI
jgi:ribosomal protein S18 acetylase RimI-like enzyme